MRVPRTLIAAMAVLLSGVAAAQTPRVHVGEINGGQDRDETGIVGFELTRDSGIDDELTVRVRISESGNMLPDGIKSQRTMTFEPGYDMAALNAEIIDDFVAEASSTVTFSVQAGSGYRIGSPSSLRFTIRDNDTGTEHAQPTVKIQGASDLVEGQAARFRLSREGDTSRSISVNVQVWASDEALLTTVGNDTIHQVAMAAGQRAQTLSIRTDTTGKTERKYLYAAVMPGTGYLPVVGDEATAELETARARPRVEFVHASGSVVEGGPVFFTLRRQPVSADSLDVRIALNTSRARNYLASAEPSQVTVRFGPYAASAFIRDDGIATVDDSTVEAGGSISATVLPGAGYEIGSQKTRTVRIEDNDGYTVRLEALSRTSWTEGQSITVKAIRERVGQLPELRVPVRISESGAMLSEESKEISGVTFARNAIWAYVSVRTVNDQKHERASTVEVELFGRNDTVLTIGANRRVSFTVRDNDDAEVLEMWSTADPARHEAYEGDMTEFLIERETKERELMPTVTARVRITRQGKLFTDTGSPETKVIRRRAKMGNPNKDVTLSTIPAKARSHTFEIELGEGEASTDFAIELPEDEKQKGSSTIRAELLTSQGYTIGTRNGGTVRVIEDDRAELKLRKPEIVREGGNANYTVSRDVAVADRTRIELEYTIETYYMRVEQTRNVTIAPNSTSRNFSIPIPADDYADSTGRIEVRIHRAWEVDAQGDERGLDFKGTEPTITVSNNITDSRRTSAVPVISIRGITTTVDEGEDLVYEISRSGSRTYPLQVHIWMETGLRRESGEHAVDFAAGQSTKRFVFTTSKDNIVEPEGVHTLRVSRGRENWYVGHGTRGQVQAYVRDSYDGTSPIVKFETSTQGTLNEGGDISLRVVRTGTNQDEVTVRIRVTQSTFVKLHPDNSAKNQTIVLAQNEASKELVLRTVDDEYPMNHGWIRVEANLEEQSYGIDRDSEVTFEWEVRSVDDPYIQITVNALVMEGENFTIALEMKNGDGDDRSIKWMTFNRGFPQATAGVDYAGQTTLETITFTTNAPSKTISIETYSDLIDEGREEFAVHFESAGSPGVYIRINMKDSFTRDEFFLASIVNDGPLPRAWLAEYTHASGTVIMDAIGERLESDQAGMWMRAFSERFEAGQSRGRLSGAIMGGDTRREKVMLGVAMAGNEAKGHYAKIRTEADLAGIYPYARVQAAPDWAVWGMTGWAIGNLRLQDEEPERSFGTIKTGIRSYMVGIGVQGQLMEESTGLKLTVDNDAAWIWSSSEEAREMRASKARSYRYRSRVWGNRVWAWEKGSITPRGLIGIEHHGGDIVGGTKRVIGVGVEVDYAELGMEAEVRRVIGEQTEGRIGIAWTSESWQGRVSKRWTLDAGSQKTRWDGYFGYDLGRDRRGLTASMSPEWNATDGTQRTTGRIGYGFARGAGELVVPYVEYEFGQEETRRGLGIDWEIDEEKRIGVYGRWNDAERGGTTREIGLEAQVRW